MFTRYLRIVFTTLLALVCQQAHAESHLMRLADVHGDTIVFTYEGDLWLAPVSGGTARRITRDGGNELYAKFSPDGKRIAFTASYDGGTDVYVMDAQGGVPQRLTYHPAADRVLGWHPDGERVLFRSNRVWPQRGEEIYLVSVEGGMPERLNVDRAGLASLSPDGSKVAYNRISRESRTWKRHKGGTAQNIWVGSLADGDYRPVTDWVGTDNYPMWSDNAVYFTSDRDFGTLNIFKYSVDDGKIKRVTDYRDYDVKYPSLGDGRIVYQHGETLHLLDVDSGKAHAVAINIPTDLVRMRPELVEVSPSRGTFRLSPTGVRMLLEARGEILNLPVEEGEPINLTQTSDSREKDPVWSPDGRWIAFISDRTGEEELYLVDQHGGEWQQLTDNGAGYRMHPAFSPDSNYLAFADKALRLNLLNLDSRKMTVVDRGEYDDGWENWSLDDFVFSPDSAWIAYAKTEQSLNKSIFLYNIADQTITRVTSELNQDFSPSFDPSGKYLYFLSHRTFSPIMGFVDQNHVFLDMCRPYMVLLAQDAASPFAPEDSEEKIADGDAESKDGENAKEEENKEEDKATRIDLDGIARRIVAVEGVEPGNYFRLTATEDGFLYLARAEHQFIKYQRVDDDTSDRLDLYQYTLEDHESKEILSGISNYHLSADGKKLVYRSRSRYGVVDAGKKADVGDGEVDLDGVRISVDRQAEFLQIFNEAWRVQRDWFYDANMHGVDWAATGEKYRRFVPYCGNRSDLNYLIGEMIGELDAGHTYVYGGDIERDVERIATGLLGADFAKEDGANFYCISRILRHTPGNPDERSPLDLPGCDVTSGDYLIAINGQEIHSGDNIYAHLQNLADKVVTISYNGTPTASDAKTCRIRTLRSEWAIRYRNWVDDNRAYVEKMSNGAIGYVHIPDMMDSGIIELAKVFFPHYYKKAFVIDERYNGGGFVSDMIIDRLER